MNVLSEKYLVDTHNYLPYKIDGGEALEGIEKLKADVAEVTKAWTDWMKEKGGSDIWADLKVMGLKFNDLSTLPDNWTRINMANQSVLVYAPKKGYTDYIQMRDLPTRPTLESLYDGKLQAMDNKGSIHLATFIEIGKRDKYLMVPRNYVAQQVGPVPGGATRVKWSEYFREAEIFDAPPAVLNVQKEAK